MIASNTCAKVTRFTETVQVGDAHFEVTGTYTDGGANWDMEHCRSGGHEIWDGLRPEWQKEIKELVGIKLRNEQRRGI